MTQAGSGTTILTGANTYSGTTTISAGTLQIGGSVEIRFGAEPGSVKLAEATQETPQSFAALGAAGTTGSLGTGAVINDAALVVNRSNSITLANAISGTGTLTQAGSGTTILTGANTFSGATTISAGTLQIGNGGTTGSLGTGAVTNNGALAINRSDAVTLAGVIAGTGALTQAGSGTTILTGANTYSGATNISAGTLQIGNGGTTGSLGTGALTNNGTLAINRSDAVTLAGVVAGTGALTQAGSGTTILTGANTYSGTTTISAGTLQIGGSVEIRFGAEPGSVKLAEATQETPQSFAALGAAGTTGSLGTGAVINDAALVVNRSNSITLANAISGTGTLTQAGSGTTILTGANTFSGATTISAGTLQIGNGGTTGSLGTGAVTNNGALAINRSDAVTLAGVIAGTGALTQAGSGTTILTGANTYSGATNISAGTLQIGNGGTTGSLGTGALTNNGTLAINRSDAVTLAGVVAGTGALTQAGSGTTILTGANTYSGATTISAGTLQIGNGGTTGSLGTGAVTNNGALAINRADAVTLAGVIAGTGALTQAGSGATTLSAANTYSGGTSVTGGILRVSSLSALGTGAVNVGSGAILEQSVASDTNFTLGLSGAGTLRKLGTGLLTFANPVTIGILAVDAGAARVNATLTGSVTVASGAFLDGIGTITGNVTNAGRLAPGNSIGALTVGGNFTQSSTGVLEVEFSNGGSLIDLLTVTGTATLGGTLRLVAEDNSEATGGTFLRAAGGVSGAFAATEVVGTNLPVTVVLSPTTGALGTVVPPVTVVAQRPTTFVANRLTALRFTDTPLLGLPQAHPIGSAPFDTDEPAGRSGHRFWLDGFGNTAEREANAGSLAFDSDIYGINFGAEFATPLPGIRVGIFGTTAEADITLAQGAGNGEQEGYLGGFFVDWASKSTALRFGFLAGHIDQTTRRTVTFNGVTSSVDGETDATAIGLFATAEQRFATLAGWDVSGRLGLNYSRANQNAYVEEGSNPLRLAVPELTDAQWRGDLYLQTQRAFGIGSNDRALTFRLAGGVGRTQDLGDLSVPVTLVDSGSAFNLDGSTRDLTQGLLDAGMRWQFIKSGEFFVDYFGRYGTDSSHSVTAGVAFRF